MKIRKLKSESGKRELIGLIIGRSKSQQGIDTGIDRLGDGFRKKEISDEIHELERDGDQNYGGLRGIWPEGGNLDHRPIPQVAGGDGKEIERHKRKKRKSKIF